VAQAVGLLGQQLLHIAGLRDIARPGTVQPRQLPLRHPLLQLRIQQFVVFGAALAKQQPVVKLLLLHPRLDVAVQPGQAGAVTNQHHRAVHIAFQPEAAVRADAQCQRGAKRHLLAQPAGCHAQLAIVPHALAHQQLQATIGWHRRNGVVARRIRFARGQSDTRSPDSHCGSWPFSGAHSSRYTAPPWLPGFKCVRLRSTNAGCCLPTANRPPPGP
jgi:hypothetical protein